jgi:ABC-type oligopeptide transport system substrate-binding subunit
VDLSVMMQRAAAGRFDAILLTWNTDPAPTSGTTQNWTRAGFGESNFLRYDNPAFDRLVERAAGGAVTREQSKIAWRQAIETINADAPAIFLFAPDNVAAIHSRVADVRLRPDSWGALVRTWRIPPDRLIDRDRVERRP